MEISLTVSGDETTNRRCSNNLLSILSEWNILAGLNVTLYIPWSSVVISFIFSHHLGYRIKKVDGNGIKALAAKRSP